MCVCLGKVGKVFIVYFTQCELDCEPCSAQFKSLSKQLLFLPLLCRIKQCLIKHGSQNSLFTDTAYFAHMVANLSLCAHFQVSIVSLLCFYYILYYNTVTTKVLRQFYFTSKRGLAVVGKNCVCNTCPKCRCSSREFSTLSFAQLSLLGDNTSLGTLVTHHNYMEDIGSRLSGFFKL